MEQTHGDFHTGTRFLSWYPATDKWIEIYRILCRMTRQSSKWHHRIYSRMSESDVFAKFCSRVSYPVDDFNPEAQSCWSWSELVGCDLVCRSVWGSAGPLLPSGMRTLEECAVFAWSPWASQPVSTFSRLCNSVPALMNSDGTHLTN